MSTPPSPARSLVFRSRQAFIALQARWLAVAPGTRAVTWAVGAGLSFTLMGIMVKLLGTRLDSLQVTFFRAAFGLATILPFAIAAGPVALRTRRPWGHVARGAFGAAGMFSGFYSLTHLPLATATAYSFTKPLFLVVLAALVLGERVRARRMAATAVGFVGVLIMLRPHAGIEFAQVVALIGAAMVAGVVVAIKLLVRTERPVTVMFYFGVLSTVITLIPALFVWRMPTGFELVLLMAVGFIGATGQSAMIRAYSLAEATVIGPLDYLRLVYAIVFGFLVFVEVPDLITLAGASVIVAATLYIAHREARLGKPAIPPTIDPAPARPSDIS
jgi:drug/metabolite transporter (DMT)-like permease